MNVAVIHPTRRVHTVTVEVPAASADEAVDFVVNRLNDTGRHAIQGTCVRSDGRSFTVRAEYEEAR